MPVEEVGLAMTQQTDVWAETLTIIGRQVTRSTFDFAIRGSELVGLGNGTYRVLAPSVLAKEWQENRLKSKIARSLASVLDCPVDQLELSFGVVEPKAGLSAAVSTPPVNFLADIDYQEAWTNSGFLKLPHYVNIFWRPFLGRAFDLLIYLQGHPISREQAQQGWMPVKRYRLRELARALAMGVNTVRGGLENCYQLRLSIKEEKPFTECCGRFGRHCWQVEPGKLPDCYHWRKGALEVLFEEGWVAVQETKAPGRARAHELRLQVWSRFCLLTPAQVAMLAEADQEKHGRWLERYASLFPADIQAVWEAETRPSLLRDLPGYAEGRQLTGSYRPSLEFMAGETGLYP
jgi:hypothetical protein